MAATTTRQFKIIDGPGQDAFLESLVEGTQVTFMLVEQTRLGPKTWHCNPKADPRLITKAYIVQVARGRDVGIFHCNHWTFIARARIGKEREEVQLKGAIGTYKRTGAARIEAENRPTA